MRILHVHSGNLYGGVETVLITLARYRDLCPQMETHFAVCFEGRLSDELRAAKAPVHFLGNVRVSRVLSVKRARRALRELLRREQFDAVVCHSTWSQAIFGANVRALHLPLVFWLHDAVSGTHWLERWACRVPPDLAICNSYFSASLLNNIYPHADPRVLYCPVYFADREFSDIERALARRELQTPDDAVVIIQVGRIEKCKGHKLHLEALAKLVEMKNWVCWQVGGSQRPQEARYLSYLRHHASRLGLSDRIRFVGERSDVTNLLAAADILSQPNTAPESFGLALIEGLSVCLPVVTTAIGGAKEIIDDSCGIFVPADDASALAASLRRLISDQDLRRRLGASGPSRARALCDPSSRLGQLNELLLELRDQHR